MPIAKIEFKLPQELDEYKNAINGSTYKFIMQDLDNALRAMIKYKDREMIKIAEVRTMLYDLLDERDLSLWE